MTVRSKPGVDEARGCVGRRALTVRDSALATGGCRFNCGGLATRLRLRLTLRGEKGAERGGVCERDQTRKTVVGTGSD